MKSPAAERGFTLVELVVTTAIVAILSAIAVTNYLAFREKTLVTVAIFDINTISKTLEAATLDNPGDLPATGDEYTAFCRSSGLPLNDPWNSPYQYYRLYGLTKQEVNKDKIARKKGPYKPLNYDYDLYSRGPDGQSKPALSAKVSRDDIVRANDGAFIGKAAAIPLEE